MSPIEKQVYRCNFQWQQELKLNVVQQLKKLPVREKETQPQEEQLERNLLVPEGEGNVKLFLFFYFN